MAACARARPYSFVSFFPFPSGWWWCRGGREKKTKLVKANEKFVGGVYVCLSFRFGRGRKRKWEKSWWNYRSDLISTQSVVCTTRRVRECLVSFFFYYFFTTEKEEKNEKKRTSGILLIAFFGFFSFSFLFFFSFTRFRNVYKGNRPFGWKGGFCSRENFWFCF